MPYEDDDEWMIDMLGEANDSHDGRSRGPRTPLEKMAVYFIAIAVLASFALLAVAYVLSAL